MSFANTSCDILVEPEAEAEPGVPAAGKGCPPGQASPLLARRCRRLADQALYRFVGIEPTAQALLVTKSSVHFRADFAPIAEQILVAAAPGPMIADPSRFDWTRLQRGIRLKPNGPVY